MNDIISFDGSIAFSSIDFLDQVINPFRVEAGETPHEPRKFLAKVEDELDLDSTGKKFRLNNNHTKSAYYDLTEDQMILVGMRESKVVRRKVLAWLKELSSAKPALPDFSNPVAAARAWADEVEQKQIAQQQLAIAAPKAEFYDAVTQSGDAISIAEVAKTLNVKGLGQNKLFKLLRDKGVLQTGGTKHNQPYQKHVDAGHFRLVETSWVAGNGDVRINMKTVVLQKGLDYIRKLVKKTNV